MAGCARAFAPCIDPRRLHVPIRTALIIRWACGSKKARVYPHTRCKLAAVQTQSVVSSMSHHLGILPSQTEEVSAAKNRKRKRGTNRLSFNNGVSLGSLTTRTRKHRDTRVEGHPNPVRENTEQDALREWFDVETLREREPTRSAI